MFKNATLSDPRAIKVAVVDDDASVRSGISRLARSHGFVCTTFDSGEKALAASELGEADCVILDIQLSGIDGFETRDRLEAKGMRLSIIFITAHPEINSRDWQRRLKGRPCLAKPFEEDDLIEAIHRTLKIFSLTWQLGIELVCRRSLWAPSDRRQSGNPTVELSHRIGRPGLTVLAFRAVGQTLGE